MALIVAGVIALSAFFVSFWYATHQPWLGLSLTVSKTGLSVVKVLEGGPSSNILEVGDVILFLADQQGSSIHLSSQDIIEDPDALPTFVERNQFRERQSQIYHILKKPVVFLGLADGRVLRVQPKETRAAESFSISFWLLPLYGVIAFVVGAAVWVIKQQFLPARYLLLSGVGAVCLLNTVNIIISREIALDGSSYQAITLLYHIGNNLFSLGIIGLIWHYPVTMGRFPIIRTLIVCMLFFMLNENLEWIELPGNSVLIQVPIYILVAASIILAQWIRSQDNPVDRASVKTLTLMILILVCAIAGYHITSVLFTGLPELSLANSFFAMFTVYIIMSMAIIRYRLFDIERWWIEIWIWFIAGVAILILDLGLARLAHMAPSSALGISVIIVAWLYFPVRQWLWGKLFRHKAKNIEEYVPVLMTNLLLENSKDNIELWKKVLNDVFKPLSIEVRPNTMQGTVVVEDGVGLRVPSPVSNHSIALSYADKGRRLFHSGDVKLAQVLLKISGQALEQREMYMKGILDERKRIMRDLHDDIGGRLLTLTHTEYSESKTAAEALKRLREIIYSLDSEQQLTLNTAVARWRIEAVERCESAGVSFEWHWQEMAKDIDITPRQFLNITLICRECLTNVFRHSTANCVVFDLSLDKAVLQLEIINDGVAENSISEHPGTGLRNVKARTEELGGSMDYILKAGSFCVKLSIPLDKLSGAHDA